MFYKQIKIQNAVQTFTILDIYNNSWTTTAILRAPLK